MDAIKVNFERERETKNKVRFAEVGTEHIGTLYISKDAMKKLGEPDKLVVAISKVVEAKA